MISSPFQCDTCWFINLQRRKPTPHLYPSDQRLLTYIRRVNLDMFWSREPTTVANTFRLLKKGRTLSEEMGLTPIHIQVGPWPIQDTCGFQVAIELLRASQKPGRYDSTYSQFESVRKLRSAYLNAYDSGPIRCLNNTMFKSDKGQMFSMLNTPTQSRLFTMFMKGCEKRMGRLVKQDLGISFAMLSAILENYEKELMDVEVSTERKRFVVVCSGAFVILWAGALRGGEVFMVEVTEFIKRRDDGRDREIDGHVVVPLMGRFKNETGERNLLLILANCTNGGLEIRKYLDRFTAVLMKEDRQERVGPAVCDHNGVVLGRRELNDELHEAMEKLQEVGSTLIPPDIEVRERFNIHRSFRRGSTTRAKEMNVPESVIELNNRWRKVQNKQGGLPSLPMSQLYVEITQVLTSKLRYSKSL